MLKQIYVSHITLQRSPKEEEAKTPYVELYRDFILRLAKLNLFS
jgi:hypothetical protein